jgi:hypothetical protein
MAVDQLGKFITPLKLKFAGNSIGFSLVDVALVMRSIVRGWWAGLRRDEFRNGDQVVGDQVEHEIGCNEADDAMFCFAH